MKAILVRYKLADTFLVGILIMIFIFLFEINFLDLLIAKWGFSHEFDVIQYSAQLLSKGADSIYWLTPSGLIALYFYFIKKNIYIASRAKFFFINIAVAGITVNILKVLFGRPRPYVYKNEGIFDFQFFQLSANYFSFPSGHTTTAFGIATALTLMFPRYGIIFFIYAFIMAYSRVACYVHYLSDVTAGAFLGVGMTLLLYHYQKVTFANKG
ncbi:phosphatase PAP2 family protein [Sulfurimonas sp. MAG313]|nr:phosphatase PAP2 family protein [Sulfurimonas sp. MAG313]MDF1881479.1 phosphatase PAP2 family protein [Sulfurimonas sp. MAG313]